MKDTRRATVHLTFDGRVLKTFKGHQAKERFENEVKVLKYLEDKGCPNVPRILETTPEDLFLIMTSCGKRVTKLSKKKQDSLFQDLEEQFGVRHDDADVRNVTYNDKAGHFCIIDFEFADILDDTDQISPVAWPHERNEDA